MSLIKQFALIVFGLITALVIIEFSLRWAEPLVDLAATNTWLGCVGWAGQPHQKAYHYTDEFTTLEIVNSAGLPDVEHSYEKPNGVFRILIVGDSFVEAYQVDLEDSFPRLLEKQLNERRSSQSPRFEIIKAGYRGWGTDQEWLYFQCEGYKYKPDLVLLGFTLNDVVDNYLPLKAQLAGWSESTPPKPYFILENGDLRRYNFPFPPPPDQISPQTLYDYLYKYAITFRVAEKGWQSLKLKIVEMSQPSASLEEKVGYKENRHPRWVLQFVMPLYERQVRLEYREAWQLTEALLTAFHQDVILQGATFAVFSNSMMWTTHPSIQELLILSDPMYTDRDFDWDQPDQRLRQSAEEMGVPYFLLDLPFKEYSADNNEHLLFFREGHWNEEGHRLVADLLYQWLVDQQLIP